MPYHNFQCLGDLPSQASQTLLIPEASLLSMVQRHQYWLWISKTQIYHFRAFLLLFYNSIYIECFPKISSCDVYISSFRSLFRCHLVRKASSDHTIVAVFSTSSSTPPVPSLDFSSQYWSFSKFILFVDIFLVYHIFPTRTELLQGQRVNKYLLNEYMHEWTK